MTAAALVRAASRRIGPADAEFVAAHLLGLKRHELFLSETELTSELTIEFDRMVSEVASGRPVQYITKSAPFLDFEVYVDERVLIPRPETEELVTRAAARMESRISNLESSIALDFGTGSGCIAIALARMLGTVRVVAVDASADALDVCRLNVGRFGLDARVSVQQADSLSSPVLSALAGKVNLLVSNPPYIPSARIAALDPKVRDHEPKFALDGGPKGTNILSMLVSGGPALMRPGGVIALEIDPSQVAELLRKAPAGTIESDLSGLPRYFFLDC